MDVLEEGEDRMVDTDDHTSDWTRSADVNTISVPRSAHGNSGPSSIVNVIVDTFFPSIV